MDDNTGLVLLALIIAAAYCFLAWNRGRNVDTTVHLTYDPTMPEPDPDFEDPGITEDGSRPTYNGAYLKRGDDK